MRLLLTLGLLKRGELALGQHQALLGDLRLERLEPLLHGLKLMALPHAAPAGEIEWPRWRTSLAIRIWPKAGCSRDRAMISASTSGGVRLARSGLRRDSS